MDRQHRVGDSRPALEPIMSRAGSGGRIQPDGVLPRTLGGPIGGGRTEVAEAAGPVAGAPADLVAEPLRVVDILSHELRSPITIIHIGAKVLREQDDRISEPVRREVVEAVEEEAERLYRLVEDLLAVARHEGNRVPLTVVPLALQHWLPTLIAAEVQAYPRLAVRTSIPPDMPPVLADDGALAQVMRNLLANAVRHAPRGMPVEVVVRPSGTRHVRIDVLDRGPGIDPSEATRIFDPFYRSASAEASGSGAGLGLAAARRLLVAMNGTIEAMAREGGGARLVVVLPVADADLEADRSAADPPSPDASSAAPSFPAQSATT